MFMCQIIEFEPVYHILLVIDSLGLPTFQGNPREWMGDNSSKSRVFNRGGRCVIVKSHRNDSNTQCP